MLSFVDHFEGSDTVGGRNSAQEIYQQYTKQIPKHISKSPKKGFVVYQNVFIEPTLYLVMIDFCDCRVNFYIFALCHVLRFFSTNINLKNDIFEIRFRERAKCKMTA